MPGNLHVLGLEFSHYSRSIMLEVLRGIGFSNSAVNFMSGEDFLEIGMEQRPDIVLLSHELNGILNMDLVMHLRRQECPFRSAAPIVLLSSQATKSVIVNARDCGIDEVVMRPVSPVQLQTKLRQLIETPRPFVTSTEYVGPCRRRKPDEHYSGSRRRLDDYKPESSREISSQPGADELASAVSELREACGELADERVSLIARVRKTADRTIALARRTNDTPLEKTAAAVKLYLDGVGARNTLETHVLETGINALTQLAILPQSYHGTRQSVANLMTVAVRKKLVVYQQRRSRTDAESDIILDEISTPNKDRLTETPPGPNKLRA